MIKNYIEMFIMTVGTIVTAGIILFLIIYFFNGALYGIKECIERRNRKKKIYETVCLLDECVKRILDNGAELENVAALTDEEVKIWINFKATLKGIRIGDIARIGYKIQYQKEKEKTSE